MILSDCQAGNMSDSCLVQALTDPQANWNNCLLPFWSNEEPKTQDSKGRTVEEKSNQCSFPPLASHAIKAKCSWPKGELKNNISCCFPAPDKGPKKRDSRCKLIHLLALSALLSTFHYELINSCQQSGWTWGKLKKSLADLFLLPVHLMPHARCQRLLWSQHLLFRGPETNWN